MKTAEEKASDFVKMFGGHLRIEVAHELAKLLKEQDNDTRHACAEAISECKRTVSMCATVDQCVAYNAGVGDAHTACIHVKAV